MVKAPGLRAVLLLLFGLVATIPVLILALGVQRPALERELADVEEKHLLLARSLATSIDVYATDAAAVLQYAAIRLAMDGANQALLQLMAALDLCALELRAVDGTQLAQARVTAECDIELTPLVRARLLTAAPTDRVAFGPVSTTSGGRPVMHLTWRLPTGEVVLGTLSTNRIRAAQAQLKFGDNGHATIVDHVGHVLAHPLEEWVQERRDISQLTPVSLLRQRDSGIVRFYSPAKAQEMVTGFARVPSTGWGTMVPQPVSELVRSAEGLVESALKLAALAAIPAALFGWWLAGRLTSPISAVVAATRRAALDEEYAAPAPEPGPTTPLEVRSLVRSFNRMLVEVRDHRIALKRSEARFRDFAEAAADWFWETDAGLRICYLSTRFSRCTGLTSAELIGQPLSRALVARVPDSARRLAVEAATTAREAFDDIAVIWEASDGDDRIHRVCGRPLFDANGQFQGYRGTGRDATETHALALQLSHQASHDDLTGLVNRREFERRLRRVLETCKIEPSQHALCYLDLDQFKVVNDTCGHVGGDELLRQLAGVLRQQLRRRDTLARLGGDEFGILLEHCSVGRATELAGSLCAALAAHRFAWDKTCFRTSASAGLVPIGAHCSGIDQILAHADAACYAAKEAGGNRVQVFRIDDLDHERRAGEMRWVPRLQHALEQGGFELYCQELRALGDHRSGRCMELLLRLKEPGGEAVSAGRFFPAAERFNLAPELDRFVLRRALDWLRERPRFVDGLDFIAVNLSGASLADLGFRKFAVEAIANSGLPARKLCFEITETAAIASISRALDLIRELKALGCRFALDDFGTGLSSLAYLKRLPVDMLKIDGAFVRDMLLEPVDMAMVRSINELSHVAGKLTVAEAVESAELLPPLMAMGVDYAQGFGVSPPQPLAALALA